MIRFNRYRESTAFKVTLALLVMLMMLSTVAIPVYGNEAEHLDEQETDSQQFETDIFPETMDDTNESLQTDSEEDEELPVNEVL